ncbi:MBL fold metallo-hydrolase [Mycolicibacterium parafortuitum]|uniref:Metallo-beta-lactamase domain-containing protein n=1 Tax=Mycolicibacterium parafortuitum TaxID=39692 RepID=A0A375YLE9_MYCPF|nr:MBL fold metallo-hydrolase [Mycolicibacterium parafortuitum]ORB30351.1 MBL fold metallo-hydrolase [Mycolicibacterium parafortuitum]SRX81975.1 hypothetical protein MPP7335_03732 [Mycolicibacterium parafortuitum]
MAALIWERISEHVIRCRLPFCDVTVGAVHADGSALVVDTGTTLSEAHAVAHDIAELTGCTVRHVVLTHNHFDHILGHSVFAAATTFCAPEVVTALAERHAWLRADAVTHGADPVEVDAALAAAVPPRYAQAAGNLTLAEDVTVRIVHPGRGHTDHDLVVLVADGPHTVVFCGDLVEESGDPCVDDQSDPAAWPATLDRLAALGGPGARYVPGHGAVVDAAFVHRQARWLAAR